MQIQTADMRGAVNNASPQKRVLSLAMVGGIHVAVIWAIIVGLYQHGSIIPSGPIKIVDVKPKVDPPQPPKTDITKTFVDPHLATAVPPDFTIDTDSTNTITVARVESHPPTITVSPVQGIAGTHTIPPYPASAIRGGIQGTVTLRLEVGSDGGIESAAIAESSGSAVLDDAAVAWVKSHWRYRPATQNGTAVASTTLAAVTFNLKNAR
jgi:protein TonB